MDLKHKPCKSRSFVSGASTIFLDRHSDSLMISWVETVLGKQSVADYKRQKPRLTGPETGQLIDHLLAMMTGHIVSYVHWKLK